MFLTLRKSGKGFNKNSEMGGEIVEVIKKVSYI